jgi:thymidylate synthase
MNTGEYQYLQILKEIIDNGEWKEPARAGMPRTKEVFFRTMTFDLAKGYPCFTTKKMAFKSCITELTWFLKGDTNIKYLLENGCNIWTDDAYKYYLRKIGDHRPMLFKEEWKEKVLAGEPWATLTRYVVTKEETKPVIEVIERYGELGKVYGAQWRNSGIGGFDQVQYVIDNIKKNPTSRYNIICAWNGDEFVGPFADVALPACHVYYQFCVNNGKLDMMMVQRSCDMFLGVPFNIASGAALLTLIAHHTGYEPGKFHWVGNCCHLYENHMDQANELITREPYPFPKLEVNWKEDIGDYLKSDFTLVNYQSHDRLTAPLSVGV